MPQGSLDGITLPAPRFRFQEGEARVQPQRWSKAPPKSEYPQNISRSFLMASLSPLARGLGDDHSFVRTREREQEMKPAGNAAHCLAGEGRAGCLSLPSFLVTQ